MKIDIRLRAQTNGEDLRESIERRLRFALARYGDEVREARLRVVDMNGPRLGVDKHCTLRVEGPRIGTLFLEDADALVGLAVERLSDRAARTIARALEHARGFGQAER